MGRFWVTIDDNEAHYLKVIMDEIFGRRNFVDTIIWQKADSPRNSARQFSSDHEYAFVYSKRPDWVPQRLPRDEASNVIYTNPDNDERGSWIPGDPYANKPYSKGLFSILGPTGRQFQPPPGRYWRVSEEKLRELDKDGRVWWGPKGEARPSIKRYLTEVGDLVPRTMWAKGVVGSNRTSKNEMRSLFPGDVSFTTPKPEALLQRVLHISTFEGDLVLDSFLGSGTTAAVADKMNRRYIGIEMGDHAETHCSPRLRKVIDNERGGISDSVGWNGGGGFRFYRLGKAIFNPEGEIDPAIKFPQLAAHVWFTETRTPRPRPRRGEARSPLLGVHEGTAYYLLYNGILGDRHPQHGNVLTRAILAELTEHDGPRVIYGESCRLSPATLDRLDIAFKQTPYDVRAR